MSILSKLFSKNKESEVTKDSETQLVKNEEFVDIQNDGDDLLKIEEILLKLELINISHGETKYLTERLSFFQNRLVEVKENREDIECPDVFNRYGGETRYRLNLSVLRDEIDDFSKIWFYLEKLDTLLHSEITEENIEEKRFVLLEIEEKIQNYNSGNKEVERNLQQKLIETIEYILEKEVALTVSKDLYSRISKENKLKIEKEYLKKIIEKVKEDVYIQKYLKEKDIGSLQFDYEMFTYLVLGKNRKEELDNNKPSEKENQKTFIDENIDITILEIEQIFGNSRLKIFEKRGTKAAISDYAILSGGYVSNNYYVGDKQKLENRTSWYWTKTECGFDEAHVVRSTGNDDCNFVDKRNVGVRAVLPLSVISNNCKNLRRAQNRILEVEYGEYPQQAASKILQNTLERLFLNKNLVRTDKKYTRDKTAYNQCGQKFQKEEQEEYEYQGKKYIRVRANSFYDGGNFTLSNGEMYNDGDYVWVEVEPIKWLVDERKNIAVSEKLLFAGVQFKHTRDYIGGKDFDNTDLKWFLDNYFSKEIIPSISYELANSNKKVKQKVKKDPLFGLNIKW